MILVQVYNCFYKKNFFIAFFDFFPPFGLDDELSNQLASFSSPNLSVIKLFIFKYIKKNLQRIFKTVLETQPLITSKKSQNKPLKAWSPNVYCGKFYMEYYNFY